MMNPEWVFESCGIKGRLMQFARAGDRVDGHGHHFGHVSYVPQGEALFERLAWDDEDLRVIERINALTGPGKITRIIEGMRMLNERKRDPAADVVERSQIVKAGPMGLIEIDAYKRHRITATVDGTVVHCLYSHRDPSGEVTEQWTGWHPAYT